MPTDLLAGRKPRNLLEDRRPTAATRFPPRDFGVELGVQSTQAPQPPTPEEVATEAAMQEEMKPIRAALEGLPPVLGPALMGAGTGLSAVALPGTRVLEALGAYKPGKTKEVLRHTQAMERVLAEQSPSARGLGGFTGALTQIAAGGGAPLGVAATFGVPAGQRTYMETGSGQAALGEGAIMALAGPILSRFGLGGGGKVSAGLVKDYIRSAIGASGTMAGIQGASELNRWAAGLPPGMEFTAED